MKKLVKFGIILVLGLSLVGCDKYENIPHENKEGSVIHTKDDYNRQTTEFTWESGISGNVEDTTTEAVTEAVTESVTEEITEAPVAENQVVDTEQSVEETTQAVDSSESTGGTEQPVE